MSTGGSSSTSSSASVPAAVVARLATTPAPAPALSPRATTLISAPPNVVIGADVAAHSTHVQPQAAAAAASSDKKDKDKDKEKTSSSSSSGSSLMKRLTSRKKSSPPLLTNPFSIDNPVFDDGYVVSSKVSLASLQPAPVHVRYVAKNVNLRMTSFLSIFLFSL